MQKMKTKETPLSSLRLLDGRRPALIICGDCEQGLVPPSFKVRRQTK